MVGGISENPLTRAKNWLFPPVASSIRASLQKAQFESMRSQVPMLLLVAGLNVGIIIAVCVHRGLPPSRYMWMAGLIPYCIIRAIMWIRRGKRPVATEKLPKLLRSNVLLTLGMVTCLGLATSATFVAGIFDGDVLIPMSLGFGTVSIAHCLYTLRAAAVGTLFMGLFPSSFAMLAVGSFDARMLALAMISVGILMIRFVSAQYDHLIERLTLEQEIRDLAHTDPLTGLANRRAVMAKLARLERKQAPFGLALMDLNGFKQVNDTLGHHAGDALLIEVGARFRAVVGDKGLVGRLGGDEFVAVFEGVDGRETLSSHGTALLSALVAPILLEGQPIRIGSSMGEALSGVDGDTTEALLKHADEALYAAKRGDRLKSGGQSLRAA